MFRSHVYAQRRATFSVFTRLINVRSLLLKVIMISSRTFIVIRLPTHRRELTPGPCHLSYLFNIQPVALYQVFRSLLTNLISFSGFRFHPVGFSLVISEFTPRSHWSTIFTTHSRKSWNRLHVAEAKWNIGGEAVQYCQYPGQSWY